jgi:hypothetical protein
MKPYIIYIAIGIVFLSLIRGSLKIDRNQRDIKLYQDLCKVDPSYCHSGQG